MVELAGLIVTAPSTPGLEPRLAVAVLLPPVPATVCGPATVAAQLEPAQDPSDVVEQLRVDSEAGLRRLTTVARVGGMGSRDRGREDGGRAATVRAAGVRRRARHVAKAVVEGVEALRGVALAAAGGDGRPGRTD